MRIIRTDKKENSVMMTIQIFMAHKFLSAESFICFFEILLFVIHSNMTKYFFPSIFGNLWFYLFDKFPMSLSIKICRLEFLGD